MRNEIEDLVKDNEICSNVHMLGVRTDIPQIMHCFDVFVFPSLYEGIPLVTIEAQAAGVPCVIASTVSRDVDINIGLVQFVDLQSNIDFWVNQILKKALKQIDQIGLFDNLL